MDGDQPLVVTSKHTVSNTITAPEDYFSLLHPSEPGTTLFETNTYYNTVALTKTLTDSDVSKIISTTNVVRQVIITELLPSKSTSVMTSYIAIDAAGNQSPANKNDHPASPLLSATDVVKTYYVTYTYFNTYLVNGSSIVRTNVSTSSDIVTEKLYIYPTSHVQNTATALTKPTPSIGENIDIENFNDNSIDSELKQLINVYATKTFMTTFTYYTTIEQGGDDPSTDSHQENEKLSTVVLSQTSVVENVVTESIPMKYLPSSAIKRLKLMLFGNNKATAIAPFASQSLYSTVVTLLGGQALEITAKRQPMNTAIHSAISSDTVHESNEGNVDNEADSELSETTDETKNEYDSDQGTAGTNDLDVLETGGQQDSVEVSQEIRPISKNPTKINKTPTASSPVSNLIGSWNFNGLKALRPMIDAVAGLINNNFGKTRQNDTINIIHHEYHTTAIPLVRIPPSNKLPTIPDYISNYNSANTTINQAPIPLPNTEPAIGQARNPIYIPVNGENGITPVPGLSTLNSFAGPNNLKSEKLNEILNQKNPNGKHKIPLLNGGIPISPGEIITANSDVILGRPTGNRPRIPLRNNNNSLNGENVKHIVHDTNTPFNMLPPLRSPPAIGLPPSDSHTVSSIQSETYVGPPPPQQIQQLPHVLKSSKHYVGQSTPTHQNKIPIYHNKPLFRVPPPPHIQQSFIPAHKMAQIHRLHSHNKLRPNVIPLNHIIQIQNQQMLPPIPTFNPHIQAAGHIMQNVVPIQPPPQNTLPYNDNMQKYVINNLGGIGTEIEIQRAPEVFSTDLPPVHIISQQQEVISMAGIEPSRIIETTKTHGFIQTTKQLPEVIESLTGQPLFVNIQPSQMAKVILPHGSTSALIYGGVQELHKSGEYFDDGSPYPNDNESQVTFIAQSKPHLTVGNSFIETAPIQNPESNVESQVIGDNAQNQFITNPQILSNQKINVHSHVLNQDVDIKAPPIIFHNPDDDTSASDINRVNEVPVINGDFEKERPRPPTFLEQQQHIEEIQVHQALPHRPQSPFHVDIESINNGMSHTAEQSSSASIENIDNESVDHSQAPSASDPIDDHHKEDDYENEQGEVIQESNAVPQLVSSGQVLSDSLNRIPNYVKPNKEQETDYETISNVREQSQTTTDPTTTTEVFEYYSTPKDVPAQQNSFRIPQIPPTMINDIYVTKPNNQSFIPSNNFQNQNLYPNALVPLQHLQPPPRFPAPQFDKRPLQIHRQPVIHAHNVQKHPTRGELNRYPSFLTNQFPPKIHDNLPPHIQYFNNLTTDSYAIVTSPPSIVMSSTDSQTQVPIESVISTHWPYTEETTSESESSSFSATTTFAPFINDQKSTPFDFSRAKPFAMKSQSPPIIRPPQKDHSTAALNLNTGEVKLAHQNGNITRQTQSSLSQNHPPKYLPTPSTEMRPPPAYRGGNKFKPFGQNIRIPLAKPTGTSIPQDIHVEQVMGMQPPPLPSVHQTYPTRIIHPNNPITQSNTKVNSFGITPPITIATQRKRPTSDTGSLHSQILHLPRQTVRYQPIRNVSATPEYKTPPQTSPKVSYQPINRIRTTASPEPIVHSDDNDDYVQFKIHDDSNIAPATHKKEYVSIRRPSITEQPPIETEKPKVSFEEDEKNVLVLGTEREIQSINISQLAVPSTIQPTPTLIASVESIPHEPVKLSSSIKTISASKYDIVEPSVVDYVPEIPTKYITSTKTLTVTTTKTTVIRSAGVTTTLTLTLTKTQTIKMIDTITTTHTLIKPTHITHSPSIRPTIFTAPVLPTLKTKSVYPSLTINGDEDDSNTSDEIESEEKEINTRLKATNLTSNGHSASSPNDSIFVVMTEEKNLGTIRLNASLLNEHTNSKTEKPFDSVDDNDDAYVDLPKRDEEDVSNDVSHVLLGGILIASPPRSEISKNSPKDAGRKQNDKGQQRPNHYDIDINSEIGEQLDVNADNVIEESKNEVNRIIGADVKCEPKCDAINNEVCQLIDGIGRCICRPGFARIFSDRPCKRNYFIIQKK